VSWLRVTVEANAGDEESVADFLNSAAGGSGVEILDQRAAKLVPEVGALAPGRILLRVYLDSTDYGDLDLDLSAWPTASIHAPEPVKSDWQQQWKAFFKPTRVSDRFIIRPPWESLEELPAPGTFEIIIEPGMSFGTGTHETTQLCIRALDGLVPAGGTVLDVGCGSGILSIAAAKLGAATITGIDIDPPAVESTHENARVNRVADRIKASNTPLDDMPGEYDLVVANILSSILITLRHGLAAHVVPGGTLLLSGVLAAEADDVGTAFEALGLEEFDRLTDSEWSCLMMRRPA